MTIIDNTVTRIHNILQFDADKLNLIEELAQIQADMLTQKLGREIPLELTFILVETTISRYRKIGDEGMTTKKIDVISNTYDTDLFKPYEAIIAKYAQESGHNKPNVRVI